MRILTVLCASVLLSSIAFSQSMVPGRPGFVGCGGGPYIPMVTTPQVSLQTVSPSPVGASNATWGLVAGATNATLSVSNVNGNVGGTYTQPVWYAGGTTPLISSPAVQLPVPIAQNQNMARMEREREHERMASVDRAWVYFASEEETASPVAASVAAKSNRPAARTITNQDVEKVNQNNGSVKYDGKTEQIK
jgi:hypothetical protein